MGWNWNKGQWPPISAARPSGSGRPASVTSIGRESRVWGYRSSRNWSGVRPAERRMENGAQGAAIQVPVVRHDYPAEWALTARHNVASPLADNVEAGRLQGSHSVPAGDDGEVRHTVTRRAAGHQTLGLRPRVPGRMVRAAAHE